jgi:two-component system, OmpR family, phosphate regulon sensor histidine kinase PhoR
VVVVLHDITRLRRLEEARREFVANVSHELRTPITSITGFVETLLDGAILEPDQARAFLRIIMRQTDRLNAIIDDLLTLSKLEQGSLAESDLLALGDLERVLQNAARACGAEAGRKDIRVDVQCGVHDRVPIHEELMEQAITNLIQNAIRYSEPGDRVVVKCRRDHGVVTIAVQDEGCGIEPRHLPRLFERFYRVDRARSRDAGGTGLGLAIVKHIAQAHGGSVEVTSRVGVGSAFTIRIPSTFGGVAVSNEAIETVQ